MEKKLGAPDVKSTRGAPRQRSRIPNLVSNSETDNLEPECSPNRLNLHGLPRVCKIEQANITERSRIHGLWPDPRKWLAPTKSRSIVGSSRETGAVFLIFLPSRTRTK
jgi:hypothetical protein